MDELAARFRELWKALTEIDGEPREPAEAGMLIDRVRDALDRRTAHLRDDAVFVAGTFSIESTVHQGLMEVHRLRHRDLGTLHALKTVAVGHADDPTLRTMLLREARIMLALDHPGIVRPQVLLRLADGRPALVMGWMEATLARMIDGASLSLADIQAIMATLMRGVAAIGHAGYVHGDLAPANLLISEGYTSLRIADFGACVAIGEKQSDYGLRLAARPFFASPEQIEGHPLDVRADIYACGVILSLMIDACAEKGEGRPRLEELAAWMRSPILRDRPPNAESVLTALEGLPISKR
jgi:type VI secretion system protein ImpN